MGDYILAATNTPGLTETVLTWVEANLLGPIPSHLNNAFSQGPLSIGLDPALLATINVTGIVLLVGSTNSFQRVPERAWTINPLALVEIALRRAVLLAGIPCLLSTLLLTFDRPDQTGDHTLLVWASNITTFGMLAAMINFIVQFIQLSVRHASVRTKHANRLRTDLTWRG